MAARIAAVRTKKMNLAAYHAACGSNEIPFIERLSCTISQACSATGLSRSTIYEEIAAGRIKSTTVRRRRLVIVSSLKTFISPPSDKSGDAPSNPKP
jgi:excisionase family DNA binding protein